MFERQTKRDNRRLPPKLMRQIVNVLCTLARVGTTSAVPSTGHSQQSNAAVRDLSKYPSESALMEEHQGSQVVTYPTAATAVIGKKVGELKVLTSVNV